MRRKDREITGRENIEPILQACKVCRVAMTGTDGWPYVIPMNFGYTWDEDGLTLYFHGGVKGKKIDSERWNLQRTMRRNGRALTLSCSTRPARAAGHTRTRLCPSPR